MGDDDVDIVAFGFAPPVAMRSVIQNYPYEREPTGRTLQRLYENNQVGSLPTLSSPSLRSPSLLSLESYHTMCPSRNRSLLAAAHLLDAKGVFQSQGNFNPFLRHTLVLIFIFILFVLGVLVDGVLRIIIEFLDIFERSTLMSIECLGSHGPNAVNARKLPQDIVLFVFEKGFCATFNGRPAKSGFELTGFFDLTVLEVLPNLC